MWQQPDADVRPGLVVGDFFVQLRSAAATLARDPDNVNPVRVRRLAETGFGTNLRFVERYDPSLPDVAGDRDQLLQVFLNLVKNAIQALGQGGHVRVGLRGDDGV